MRWSSRYYDSANVHRLTRPSQSAVVRTKVIGLVLLAAFAPWAWVPEVYKSIQELRRLPFHFAGGVLYLTVVLVAFVGLAVTPFLRNTLWRVALVGLFLAAFVVDRAVLDMSGSHVNTSLIEIMWQNRALGGQVFRDFLPIIVPHLVVGLGLGGILAWPLPNGLRAKFALLPVASLVLVAYQYSSWGEMLTGYPSPFLIPARVAWLLTAPPTHSQLPLKPVALPLGPSLVEPPFEKIVLVMDESVRGDYLTINNPAMATTPFLQDAPSGMVNFGVATSGSNCSFQSRWMFRRGARPWQLPDRPSLTTSDSDGIVTGPRTTLWQFAKAAGYQTIYLDVYARSYGDMHTGLTAAELSSVDTHTVLEQPGYQRDISAAGMIASILRKKGPMFVYFDKFGTHFPYDESTPPDFNRFARPDGTRFVYYRKTLEDLTGSYKNAIAWSVDGFFRELLPNIDLDRVLLLYTSDHGQNLWDDGTTFWRHCDTNPPATELWIPLLAFTGNEQFRSALSASAARSPNQATHFDIFPTLLVAMGYNPQAVEATYGSNLLNIPAGRSRRFLIGDVNGRAYRVWIDINDTGVRLRDRLAAGCISCLFK